MNSSRSGNARSRGKWPLLGFILLSSIAGYLFFSIYAIPRQESYIGENQAELFSSHFDGLNQVLDDYISRGLSDDERLYILEHWATDTRNVSDLDASNPTHFAHEVTRLQQRDFYLSLLDNEEALVRKEAASLRQAIDNGIATWSGPYGIELETKFGLDHRTRYSAILQYGSERISPLFELNPTISSNFRQYRSDFNGVLRTYYIGQTVLFLPILAAIFFLVRLISSLLIRMNSGESQ